MKEKILAIFLSFLMFILFLGLPLIFPILGLWAIDNNIYFLIIISTIFSIIYILTDISRGNLIKNIIFFIITFFHAKSYETFSPIIVTIIELPLLDFFWILINIIQAKLFGNIKNNSSNTKHSSICPSCKKEINDSWLFCNNCGYKLK